MALYYVRSAAAGAGTGADWTNAYTTLALALSTAPTKVAGDTYYVADDHAESTAAAVILTFPGTVAAPDRIICVNRAGTVPPVSADLRTTATVSTTLASAISLNGFFYCYGIIFQSCVGASTSSGSINIASTASNQQRFDNCVFRLQNTASGSNITIAVSSAVYLNNCSFKFGNISGIISLSRSRFFWNNSLNAIDNTGAIPTTLFGVVSGAFVVLEGVDLTAMSSGKTLFTSAANIPANMSIKDCKLTSGVIISAAQTGGVGMGDAQLIRCETGGLTNTRYERYNYAGILTTEPTIVRTGGATDGTTPISYRVATTNSSWAYPFTCPPISIWNETTGSAVTATVYGAVTGGTISNKEDIWIDVEYLGSQAGVTQGIIATSGNPILSTGVANTSDGSTWGGTGTTPFKMAVTVTPQAKGPITVYVRCAKPANAYYYIDPKVVLT